MTYGALSHLYAPILDQQKPLFQLEPHFDQNDFNREQQKTPMPKVRVADWE